MSRTVPVSSNQSPGNFVTGALWNAGPAASNTFLTGAPMAVIFQTTVQTLATGTQAAITFDSTSVDTDSQHSNVTNNSRFTCQVAGWYLLLGTVQFNNIAGGNRACWFAKNGTTSNQFQGALGASGVNVFTAISCVGMIHLNVGDYIELDGFQDQGGNVATHTLGSSLCALWIAGP
jgi:hypothetical protein